MDFAALVNDGKVFPTGQKYVHGARIGFFGANHRLPTAENSPFKLEVENIAVDKIDGESATATVTYSFALPDDFGAAPIKALLQRERNETLQLKLGASPFFGQEKLWQIVPPAELPQKPELKEGAVDIEDLNRWWTHLSFVLAQKQPVDAADLKAKRSMSHLKQLALGVIQFVQDYNERYAFAPEYLEEAVLPYTKNKELFFVPNTRELYTFNANLSDKSLAQINEVAQTVLFYEGENENPTFRYDGKAAIAFVDGHVALVSPEEAQKLIWEP